MSEIVNKVATSGIVTINLEDYYTEGERQEFDIKAFLFQELILKEKEFREALKNHDWSLYKNKFVNIMCSADAIVPTWAFMLVSLELEAYAKRVFCCSKEEMELMLFKDKLSSIKPEEYKGARIVIKGCADKPVPLNAFVELTTLLKAQAKSIMYGEPCSTVPLYKSKP
jgi:hypothetical protein